MDKNRIKLTIEARYGPVEYFNSRPAGSQLVCFIRFTNQNTINCIMEQRIILIGKEVARVTYADVTSYQFMQEIKLKPAVHLTDLPNHITPREILHALKTLRPYPFLSRPTETATDLR